MKKLAIAVAGAAAMMALPAVAGINPLDPGLPQGWASATYGVNIGDATVLPGTITGAAATTKLSVLDSYSSAMCVECHSRNPSDRITAPSDQAGGLAVTKATHQGSHFVVGQGLVTATGGGVTVAGVRNDGGYEKLSLWLPGGTAGKGLSKYGSKAATFADNDILNAQAVQIPGDITCESCHNILVNRGDQLLLGAYANGTTSAAVGTEGAARNGDQMCVACHGNGVETYAGFHANGNLRNFNNTARKRHHVLTDLGGAMADDMVDAAFYNPDGDPGGIATNDSVMWAPNYSYEIGNGGVFNAWVYDRTVANDGSEAYAFRNRWNVTGAGTLAQAIATGDIPTTTEIMCVSCHRPHNAETLAGAFILRRGIQADGYASGNAASGIQRQRDFNATFTQKIYGEYVPLCKGCHSGYGD